MVLGKSQIFSEKNLGESEGRRAFHVHVLRGAAAQVRGHGVVQEEVVEQHAALGVYLMVA